MVNNQVMLITYGDSLGRDLRELRHILNDCLRGIIGGIHVLPFFPSSADRGFAPLCYTEVDPRLGSWEDIRQLGDEYSLMTDFMINHISRQSVFFQDFQEHKDRSTYRDFFIRFQDFWPDGQPSEADIERIYKRKPRAPYIDVTFADGSSEKLWCTFDSEQVDLNLESTVTKQFVADSLVHLAEQGSSIIRLDAFAYATKKIGTDCFFVEPDVWHLLEMATEILAPYQVEILPEIHEHYTMQMKLAERGYWVYDFALPMLVLYSLYSGSAANLIHWLKICPHKQFTTLDTHDGIGVVDAIDLLSDEQIEQTREYLYQRGANVKRIYSSTAYQNLDIYQMNCTYYSALGHNDEAYLTARAIQFFAPGIPQVYYVGLLAGENDIELVERTRVGRDINRHYYDREDIERNLKRPVVQRLLALIRFRNNYPAFQGEYTVVDHQDDSVVMLRWQQDEYDAVLTANVATNKCHIHYFHAEEGEYVDMEVS